MDQQQLAWHHEVVSEAMSDTVRGLEGQSVLSGFYLAGGTGLALQFGHRLSDDLDFFRPQGFDEDQLIPEARKAGEFSIFSKAPRTLHIVMKGVKVSFFAYDYPLLFPLREYRSIQVADARDIACMKVSAVAGRGTKRDFVDVHTAANRYGLADLLSMFDQKYAGTHYNAVHLRKSLVYFDDAEKDPMPEMLIPTSWEAVKAFFTAEVPRLP